MKATDLMTNNMSDKFYVFVGAKKNFVNQWSCTTLEKAVKSIKLFKLENPQKQRNFAIIKDRDSWKTIKEISLFTT